MRNAKHMIKSPLKKLQVKDSIHLNLINVTLFIRELEHYIEML